MTIVVTLQGRVCAYLGRIARVYVQRTTIGDKAPRFGRWVNDGPWDRAATFVHGTLWPLLTS